MSLFEEWSVSDDQLKAWALARRAKHTALAGALLGLIATGSIAARVDLRNSATVAGFAVASLLLVAATVVALYQKCPRCKKTWNARGLFGLHMPFSSQCLNCELAAPDPGPSRALPITSLLLAPSVVSLAILFAVHLFAPHPTVHTGVRVKAIDALRGTSDYVSFADGRVRPELVGSYVHKKAIYHMVPLVADDWKIDQPVPLWVVCRAGPRTGNCVDPAPWIVLLGSAAQQRTPLENARIVPHADVTRDGTGWQRATRDAEEKHGILSHPRAIVVEWPGDPSRD